MNDFIPHFDFQRVFLAPWTANNLESTAWIALMGFLVTAACGLVGNYLILRRMALVGDAISHSVLPGIAIAFLLSRSRSATAMFVGALAAGIVTTVIIEVIHHKTRVKQDSAIGIAFTTLFAIGVILVSLFAAKVDLDQECVLYGEIAFVPLGEFTSFAGIVLGPPSVVRMAIVTLATVLLIAVFYKELLVSSFDPGLAASLGINAVLVHYALMCWLSVVVVSAFEAVGAILVIAMLILPGATASLISQRLPVIMGLTVLHAALSSVLGIHLATWLECSTAAAMVIMASTLFGAAWIFSPTDGLLRRWLRKRLAEPAVEPTVQMPQNS
ncbi:MAG: metal ABC transporter permease [Verrucomicrobia bacterium]|nr:metal ABC transporter permease [Verrucomicrobiota bacterium]